MDPQGIMLSQAGQNKKDKILYELTYMWNLKKQKKKSLHIQKIDWLMVSRNKGLGVDKMQAGDQKAQTSSYQVGQSWGCTTHYDDYS